MAYIRQTLLEFPYLHNQTPSQPRVLKLKRKSYAAVVRGQRSLTTDVRPVMFDPKPIRVAKPPRFHPPILHHDVSSTTASNNLAAKPHRLRRASPSPNPAGRVYWYMAPKKHRLQKPPCKYLLFRSLTKITLHPESIFLLSWSENRV